MAISNRLKLIFGGIIGAPASPVSFQLPDLARALPIDLERLLDRQDLTLRQRVLVLEQTVRNLKLVIEADDTEIYELQARLGLDEAG